MLQWVGHGGIHIRCSRLLDKARVRGLIFKHQPGYIHQLQNNYTIIVAADLSPEMERVVVIKELMHCYLGPDGGGVYATNNQFVFDSAFKSFFRQSYAIDSHPNQAERKAMWMALGVICPEVERMQYQVRVNDPNDAFTVANFAAVFRISEHHADAILSEQYEREIAEILE